MHWPARICHVVPTADLRSSHSSAPRAGRRAFFLRAAPARCHDRYGTLRAAGLTPRPCDCARVGAELLDRQLRAPEIAAHYASTSTKSERRLHFYVRTLEHWVITTLETPALTAKHCVQRRPSRLRY